MNRYDVIVIGAGPGGYPCAIRLGQLKKKVLVVEAKYLGGLCLNWGCIPTKALSYAAEITDQFNKAKQIGLKIDVRGFDLNTLKNWKDGVVKRLRAGIEYLFKSNGIDWINGVARIISENRVEVEKEGKKESFDAENIVIATGTEVIPLPGFDFDHKCIIDTDDALELRDVPENLLVIGAGASGLEMATIYSRLGSQVTVVEIMDQILPGMEHELCENLYKIIKKSGIEIYLSSQVIGYEIKENKLQVSIKKSEGDITQPFDKMLVTVGRRPVNNAFKDIDLESDEKGYIKVNDKLKTSLKSIYAIGDVIGAPLLAHKATKQGIAVAEIICGLKKEFHKTVVPSCVFTVPPLSSVGMTEKEAIARGHKIMIGRFPYRASGKALSMSETEGMVKIVGDENGKLLGLHILGAESSNLIGEGILAIDKDLSVNDIAESIHPHPTLTEILQEAAENFFKKAIHIPNK